MAVALKSITFNSARELAAFCAGTLTFANITGPAAQANVISVTYDTASGKYVLFYT